MEGELVLPRARGIRRRYRYWALAEVSHLRCPLGTGSAYGNGNGDVTSSCWSHHHGNISPLLVLNVSLQSGVSVLCVT